MSESFYPTLEPPAAGSAESGPDHPAVMILEDELIIATDLRTRLEAMGYTVAGIHTDGEHAIRAMTRERPELILVDIGLHGDLDGIEAARRVRAEHDVPLVFITAYGDDATRIRAMEVPASAYLLKPIADEEFSGIIRKLLPAAVPPASQAKPPCQEPPKPATQQVRSATTAPPAPSPRVSVPAPAPLETTRAAPQEGPPQVSRRPVRAATPKAPVLAARARRRRAMKPQWEYVFNTYLPRHHCVLYRDNVLGVQLQVITKTSGWVVRPKTYYFIDGVRRSFDSEAKLIRHLHRLMVRRWRAQLPFWKRVRSWFLR